jgi:hypothetical protein
MGRATRTRTIVLALVTAAAVTTMWGGIAEAQRDPGLNQPGAAGNRTVDPGLNQPGAEGNRRRR